MPFDPIHQAETLEHLAQLRLDSNKPEEVKQLDNQLVSEWLALKPAERGQVVSALTEHHGGNQDNALPLFTGAHTKDGNQDWTLAGFEKSPADRKPGSDSLEIVITESQQGKKITLAHQGKADAVPVLDLQRIIPAGK